MRSQVKTRKKMSRNDKQLYGMLIVPVVFFVLFKYLPMAGVVIAFKDYNIFDGGMFGGDFIGLAHFKEAFASKDFWLAVKNTLVLNMGDLLLGFPIPILMAIGLNELRNRKIVKMAQTLTYLPNFLSWVIISGIVFQIFANTGLINNVLSAFGMPRIDFLSDPFRWRIVYWIAGIWQSAGYALIIYYAALMNVDVTLYEAAYIDGATRLQRIWHVTLPMIRPTISMMLIMNLGKIMTISFDRPYMLGNTLVSDVSQVISTYVYTLGISSARFDYATAVGLFQSVIGIILILSANKMAKKFGEEGII